MYLVKPITNKAKKFIKERVSIEPWQWMGDRFAVDHHFIDFLFEGMTEEGLAVKKDFTIEYA